MNSRLAHLGRLALAAVLAAGLSTATLHAQDAKQDMKSAGHETKDATVDAGHGVKKGTEKGYDKTKSGTKKAYHKTKSGTKKAWHNTKKTLDPHANSEDKNHQ